MCASPGPSTLLPGGAHGHADGGDNDLRGGHAHDNGVADEIGTLGKGYVGNDDVDEGVDDSAAVPVDYDSGADDDVE